METILQLTPHDPLVARDGRPFGAGQGNRMRGLPWPLPSVVAGSFRTALVKAGSGDFSGDIPQRLMQVAVAGVFPVTMKDGKPQEMYLPSPTDCAWDEKSSKVHRVQPISLEAGEGVDFSNDALGLWPVRLTGEQSAEDFKAKTVPAWWPLSKMGEWLTSTATGYGPEWFATGFLGPAVQTMRDHVCLDAERGAAAEGQIFATAGLNVTHLPRFGVDGSRPFHERFAEITLSGRITIPDSETAFTLDDHFKIWHPLGGERRMVHWRQAELNLWKWPPAIRDALEKTERIRMVLATPAIFKGGWKPGWLTNGLQGELCGVKLKLVGASIGRWKAVSGWSLASPRGPKPIRRMAPAGSVYFFECQKGAAAKLADLWLKSVSDDDQERRDGFGLALWGIW